MSDEDEPDKRAEPVPELKVLEGNRPVPLPTVLNCIRGYLRDIDDRAKKGQVRAIAVGLVLANGDVAAYSVGETTVQRLAAAAVAMKMTPSLVDDD